MLSRKQGEDRWDSGPEEGGLAKSHAARLLSELAGYDKLHALMVRSGAAEALADRGEELVRLIHVTFAHSSETCGNRLGRWLPLHIDK